MRRWARQDGQALLLLVAGLAATLIGALILGAVARGLGAGGARQRAADLAALAGARSMHEAYPRLFESARLAGRPNPRHLERAAYLALARAAAEQTARRNGAHDVRVRFPDGATIAPVRIRVTVADPVRLGTGGGGRGGAHPGTAAAQRLPP